MQQIIENIESLLTNKTVLEEKRNITAILQTVESDVLNTALEAPDQEIQKVQKSTVGKKTVRPETHRGVVINWGPHQAMREVNKDCVCPFIQLPSWR